jgi:hypothetical protein
MLGRIQGEADDARIMDATTHSIPSNDDQISWATLAEKLSEAVAKQGDILAGLHSRVPSDDLWQYKALLDTGEDIFAVTLAAFWAIDALGKQPPKVRDPWPLGGLDAEDRLRIWAADPTGDRRPRWMIVAMAATAWCNALEGFLGGLTATAVDAHAVQRVRAAFPEADIQWESFETARVQIAQRMVPSTKRKGQSLRYIEAVFGCKIEEDIGLGLRALVVFRNSVIHPTRGRAHDEHRNHPCSDEWACWAGTVRALAGLLMKSLADRLDERRAAGESIPLFRGPNAQHR